MNRRNVIAIITATLMLPMGLIAAPSKDRPSKPSCKDCKKCGRACKCECSKGCKCKPGCCKADRPSPPRGFDGRTPSFRPPNSRPPSGFDRRTPGFGPPSHGRPYHNKESRFEKDEARHLPSSKHNPTNYEIMMRRFDKNKDGKIQAEEKKAAQDWFRERVSLWQK